MLFYSNGYIADFIYEISSDDRNSVYEMVVISVGFYTVCCYPTSVLVLSINRRNLVKVQDELIQLDPTLGPKNSKKLIFVIFQLCVAFTLVASPTVHYWLNANICINIFLIMVPIVFSDLAVEFQFSKFVRLLTQHFSNINSMLVTACSPDKSRNYVTCKGSLRSTQLLMSLMILRVMLVSW
jgi:hypothetical protein